jgi:hypothetical protein
VIQDQTNNPGKTVKWSERQAFGQKQPSRKSRGAIVWARLSSCLPASCKWKDLTNWWWAVEETSEHYIHPNKKTAAGWHFLPYPTLFVTACIIVGITLMLIGIEEMLEATSRFEFALRNWLVLINMLVKHLRVGFLGTGLADSATRDLLSEMSSGIQASHVSLEQLRLNMGYVAALGAHDYGLGLEAYQSLRRTINVTDPRTLRWLGHTSSSTHVAAHHLEVWHRAWLTVDETRKEGHGATTTTFDTVMRNQTVQALSRSVLLRASFSIALHELKMESIAMKSLLGEAADGMKGEAQAMQELGGTLMNIYMQVVRALDQGVQIIGEWIRPRQLETFPVVTACHVVTVVCVVQPQYSITQQLCISIRRYNGQCRPRDLLLPLALLHACYCIPALLLPLQIFKMTLYFLLQALRWQRWWRQQRPQ